MNIKIIKNFDEFLKLKYEWNKLLENSYNNVFFLRHEWLSSWWKSFGDQHELFVIVICEDSNLIAAAPLMIFKKKFLGLTLFRRLQFIAHEDSDYLDFVVQKGKESFFNKLIEEIRKHSSLWDWMHFIYIPEFSYFLKNWVSAFKKDFNEVDLSVIVDLKNFSSFEQFSRSLDKKVRQDIVRQKNNINKAGKVTFEVYKSKKDILPLIENFFDLHRTKWEGQSQISKFTRSDYVNFYKTSVELFDATEILEFSLLKCDNEIIAMHYGFVYDNRYYWYTPTYNYKFQKYSPGKLLVATIIDSCINRNIEIFDLLRGNEKYKYFWGRDEVKLYSVLKIKDNFKCFVKYLVFVRLRTFFVGSLIGKILKKAKNYLQN